MKRPRKAVRIALPILFIGILALAALWRLGAPVDALRAPGGPSARPAPLAPLTRIADVEAATSVLRRASLEGVRVQELPSRRTAWIDSESAPLVTTATGRIFAVLDLDVKRPAELRWEPGARVTLIGLVRPGPGAAEAMRLWMIDEATAADLEKRGTYLHVTEIRIAN